jgi:hypothetical protein
MGNWDTQLKSLDNQIEFERINNQKVFRLIQAMEKGEHDFVDKLIESGVNIDGILNLTSNDDVPTPESWKHLFVEQSKEIKLSPLVFVTLKNLPHWVKFFT